MTEPNEPFMEEACVQRDRKFFEDNPERTVCIRPVMPGEFAPNLDAKPVLYRGQSMASAIMAQATYAANADAAARNTPEGYVQMTVVMQVQEGMRLRHHIYLLKGIAWEFLTEDHINSLIGR